MNYKVIPLSIAVPIALSFFAVSCSDSEISSSDISTISQSIYVVPASYTGEPYNRSYSSDNFYVDINEKIRICGVYSINGEHVSAETAIPYYKTNKWAIDKDEASGASVYYSFNKAGVHDVTFETVDHLNDTLLSHAKIYVNTPAKVSLQSPVNNYNQVDGNNEDGLELSWKLSGVDSWETASCTLYAGYAKDSVWDSPLGNMDCFESVLLLSQLDLPIYNVSDTAKYETKNVTIYWGVKAITENSKGNQEPAFSEIFQFSTKLHNNGDAILKVPVSTLYNQYPEKSQLTGAILSSAGDTLSVIPSIKSSIQESLPPQSNVKVVVCEEKFKEYGCDSIIVDLAPSTKTITDTLFLRDKVKPNMIPVETETHTVSPLRFYVLDNGSGINASKIQAFMDKDTLGTTFENNILSIENSCRNECNLVIYAEDYARNKTPSVQWKIKTDKEYTYISGPFAKTEADE